MFKIIQILFIGFTAALLLTACGKKEEAPVAAEPAKPAETSPAVVEAKPEPKVEFALDCVSEKSDRSRAIFVSLGNNAMFTNFRYGSQKALTLIETDPASYKYSIDTEFTGYGAKKIEGKTITVNRENLSILYSYGVGADPFRCSKVADPVKAHEESKQLLISEANRVADEAEKARANDERQNQEQLKRNKI